MAPGAGVREPLVVTLPAPCPRCPAGIVAVREQSWASPLGRHRSVWVDEPLRCSGGCALSGDDVLRLLGRVYDRPAHQLPLMEAA